MKIGPQVLGIVALAGLLIGGLRSDRLPAVSETRLQAAAANLQIGMTSEQARSAMQIPRSCGPELTRSSGWRRASYHDPQSGESLTLEYRDQARPRVLVLSSQLKVLNAPGQEDFRLVGWELGR